MCFPIGAAAVLHIKVFVQGVVYAVVHTRTQLKSADDLVVFTIHEFDGIGIAAVGDDKAVGLGLKGHRQRLAETLDTLNPFSRPEIEHFDGLLIFGRKEQTVTLEVEPKMVEITCETWHRGRRNQFQWWLLLRPHRYHTHSKCHQTNSQRLSQFIPLGNAAGRHVVEHTIGLHQSWPLLHISSRTPRPINTASSDGRRNTCLKFTRRSLKSQGLSWTLIQAQLDLVELRLSDGS